MEAFKQELVLLRSLLLGDEFEWHLADEQAQQAWEAALTDDGPVPHEPPDFSVHLADGVELGIQFSGDGDLEPSITMHAARLKREEQARLSEELSEQMQSSQGEESRLTAVVSAMQSYVAANPPIRPQQDRRQEPPPPEGAAEINLKVVLIWSHHLLATGKRKNIVQWSSELKLWGISKPGYPGVIVIEGLTSSVDEFVWRIKQLNWKALQIRCEIDHPAVTPPDHIVNPVSREDWALRTQAKLAKSLAGDAEEKIGAREVEGLNEVGLLMTRAGLEDVFRTALKL